MQWLNYINYELNRGEFQRVEALFQECFVVTESVALCRLYVSYVRRVNDVITGGENARGIVIQAFEFAIGKVGIDVSSGDLWNDYLDFLKTWTPAASWEQQQKADLIRKVYKRYLAIPTESIASAWLQYAQWENETNSATASKFIAEKSAEFMQARSWNTEWQNAVENRLSRRIVVGDATQDQLRLWLNWIDLETKNTMELKDTNLLDKRILYAYRQALWTLPLVSELWFKFARYWLVTNEEANTSKCIELLKKGLALNPESFLLTFQLAELFEKEGNSEAIRDTYMDLFGHLNTDYVAVTNEIENIQKLLQTVSIEQDIKEVNDDMVQEPVKLKLHLTRDEFTKVKKLRSTQTRLSDAITLVYTKFMVSARRQGGIKEARLIFKQGRKAFPDIGFHFFVQNALLEHYSDNKKIALRIFDLALRARDFAFNSQFLLEYFEFLVNCSEVDSIRKLVQTSDTTFAKEIGSLEESLEQPDTPDYVKSKITADIKRHKSSLRLLFRAYIAYASTFLSLDTAHSFATKYEQLFPGDDPIVLFTDRYCLGKNNLVRKMEWSGEYEDLENGSEEPEVKRRKVEKVPIPPAQQQPAASVPKSISATTAVGENSKISSEAESRVGPLITNLMGSLPNASYFGHASESVFNPHKLVQLFANLPNVPTN